MPGDSHKDGAERLQTLWTIFVIGGVVSLFLTALMYSQFCWSMWFLGLPVVAHIWLGVRIACPGACCIVLCPDIPTDIIEATHFVAKATKVAAGYAFFVAASSAFSSWTSDDLRAECGDKKCTGLTESACNKVCGCSESLVVGVGFVMVTVYIGIGAVALIIISQAGGLATTRRRGRFDTIPKSDSESEEEDDDEEELLPPPALQTTSTKKMFSRMADAFDEAPAPAATATATPTPVAGAATPAAPAVSTQPLPPVTAGPDALPSAKAEPAQTEA